MMFLLKQAILPIKCKYKIPTKQYLDQGKYPVIDQGQEFIGGYTNDEAGVISQLPVIVFGDHTRVFKYVDFPFVAGADGVKIFQAKSCLLPKLLFYFLQAVTLPDRGYARHYQYLVKSMIPVPPLAEQKKIVKKIEEFFGVIDAQVKRLEATQEALVSYRQSILSDCLKNATGISTTLGKIVKPRRERVSFDGTNGHIIFIGMDCIEPNALKPHKTDLLENTKSTCFVFHKDDVLYGRMRSYLNKVFKAETNGAASAEFIVFPPTDTILSDYLKYLLHQQDFVSFATRNASGDRPRVKFEEDLAPFPFTLPSLSEQKAIVKKIETAFAFADKAQAAITDTLEQAKQLKQSILKRAFEGKFVPQDPNDKPVDLTQLKKDKQK